MKTPRCAAGALALCLVSSVIPAQAEQFPDGQWRTRCFNVKEKYSDFLSIENGRLYVDFIVRSAWTISTIKYRDNVIGQPSGATGAVFQWEKDDPTLTADDIPDPARFCARLKELAESDTPNLAKKIWEALPEELRAQAARLADKQKGAELDRDALVAVLNRLCADGAAFEEPFLKVITNRSDPVYARRAFMELQKVKADPAAPANEVRRLNRKLLEYTFAGAVSNLQQAIGTGHGGEIVRNVRLEADGKTVFLVKDGKLQDEAKGSYAGKTVTLVKESVIGPFDHVAAFKFAEGGEGYEAVHRFTANEEMARGHFAGYTYTFMHMMPVSFCDFWVDRGDGTEWEGKAEPKEAKDRQLINEPWKTMIAYSEELKTGVVHNYPERYPGLNHIYARSGKDKKWRASLARRERWQVGDTIELRLMVTPFAAGPEEWKTKGKEIATTDVFPK